jgi:fermentation-respiration switch protein FrsA (DUF1100 family)
VLKAPFTSIPEVALDFPIFKFFPILKPLSFIPGCTAIMWRISETHFDSLTAIKRVTAPILIVHGSNDRTVSSQHGHRLFWSTVVHHLQTSDHITTTLDTSPVDRHSLIIHVTDQHRHHVHETSNKEDTQWQLTQHNITLLEMHHADHDDLQEFDRVWTVIGELIRPVLKQSE